MEAAYRVYHRNAGNFLDKAPNGEPSILFRTLLDYFDGDVKKAIVAKSNVYSDEFFNWFGQWIGKYIEDTDGEVDFGEVSKAVDTNGEPLVVWHGTDKVFDTFEYDEDGKRGSHKVHDRHSFFFTGSKEKAFKYKHAITMPVYLNMRTPGESSVNDGKYNTIEEYTERENELIRDPQYDSVFIERYDKEGDNHGAIPTKQWVVKKPNQIKHVENLGTWNPKEDNIYYAPDVEEKQDKLITEFGLGNKFKRASITELFGHKLMSGQTVSSRDLISRLLELQTFSNSNMDLARLISRHDIPVKLEALPSGKLMACRTYEDGSVVILVNPNHSDRVSNRRLSDSLLHEVIHAITV